VTAPVDELLPDARALAERTRALPSVRKLMDQLRIGRPKAREIRARLASEIHRATSRRGRVQSGRTATGRRRRRATLRLIHASAAPVSLGDSVSDPWIYSVPVQSPGALRTTTEALRPVDSVAPVPPQASQRRTVKAWPLLLLALPAFVAIWSGWVGLGGLTGFGVVHPLPGIADGVSLNTAITLPIGGETYGAYALYVWLSGNVPSRARRFAMWSAVGSLGLGAAGQIAYHLMVAAGMTAAPWWITTIVACIPVAVLGMGAALYHLVHAGQE
jgi:hypothetical protein